MPTDSSSITEEDFIAARNVAYRCLSAVHRLSFTLNPISPLLLDLSVSKPDDLPMLPANKEFSWTTRAVECLSKVLASAGPQVLAKRIVWDSIDWNDCECPDKIKKVKKWLLSNSVGEPWKSYSTAHERAYWRARDLWKEIECCILSSNDWAWYESAPDFHLDLERIGKNVEEVKECICEKNLCSFNREAVKAEVEIESARALAAWKAEVDAIPVAGQNRVTIAEPSGNADKQKEDTRYRFVAETDFYVLAWNGAEDRFRKMNGFDYIYQVLQAQKRRVSLEELTGSSVVKRESKQEILDPDAKKAYSDRLQELEGEIDDAKRYHDLALQERAETEKQQILAQLEANSGLGGKTRGMASGRDKLRSQVSNANGRAIKKIQDSAKPEMRELATHLSAALSVEGGDLVYRSPTEISWEFE